MLITVEIQNRNTDHIIANKSQSRETHITLRCLGTLANIIVIEGHL